MADGIRDARLRELKFLAEIERVGRFNIEGLRNIPPQQKDMIIHLFYESYLDGLSWLSFPDNAFPTHAPVAQRLPSLHREFLHRDLDSALRDQQIPVRLNHKGRLRLAELEQTLRTGRDREPLGILWSKRHLEQALVIAVLSAGEESPISVAYLDMNGLKGINDAHGHQAGDLAIKIYVQTVAMLMGENAEGFRGDGGDEVVVIMRNTPAEKARETMRAILEQLGKESVQIGADKIAASLSASCGVASTTDPGIDPQELLQEADAAQHQAKEASKGESRRSVLMLEGGKAEFIVRKND